MSSNGNLWEPPSLPATLNPDPQPDLRLPVSIQYLAIAVHHQQIQPCIVCNICKIPCDKQSITTWVILIHVLVVGLLLWHSYVASDVIYIPDIITPQILGGAAQIDQQGIPWSNVQWERMRFRQHRIRSYRRNHESTIVQVALQPQATQSRIGASPYFEYAAGYRKVNSDIVHFQLRHIIHAPTKHNFLFQSA